MKSDRIARVAGFAALSLAAALPATAQNFPTRPVHLIVAYSAGGTGDVIARTISDALSARLGQTVVVENRAGASGAIGARSVATADPDGHTLLVGQTAEVAINQHFLGNQGYDPDKDLLPVALAGVVPLALSVPAQAPYSTVEELVAVLKSGKALTFASAGTGTPGHFAGEILKLRTKASMTHVPYKGAGPALNDLIGNHVDMYFPGFPAVMPQMKAGTLKILAVSSAKRSPAGPDVPTVAEKTGIQEFDFTLWAGIFAPKGTPKEIVAKLNTEINAVLNDPAIRKKLTDGGTDVTAMSVDQFTQFVKSESAKYVQVIKETGVKPE
jgi:tripartite-type tricarboxylate transporter receptor subunit TctC